MITATHNNQRIDIIDVSSGKRRGEQKVCIELKTTNIGEMREFGQAQWMVVQKQKAQKKNCMKKMRPFRDLIPLRKSHAEKFNVARFCSFDVKRRDWQREILLYLFHNRTSFRPYSLQCKKKKQIIIIHVHQSERAWWRWSETEAFF